MKLDLNFILIGLDGQPSKGTFDTTHAGAVVAATLAYLPKQHSEVSPLKRTIIAQELYKKNPVEVEKHELKGIREIINWPDAGFSPIILMQVNEVIDKLLE